MRNNPFSNESPIDNATQPTLEQRTFSGQDARERAVFVIARNLIPIIGVLFLNWSALNLLLLYFVDTLGGMWALIAALLTQFFGGWTTLPWAQRFTNLLWVLGLSLFLIAFFAIPLGMPVFIMLMSREWSWQAAMNDQGFIFGLVSIAALSLASMLRMAFRFHQTPSDEKWSRNAFGLLFLRWVFTVFIFFTLGGFVLPFGEILVIILYAGATVISELYPERFLAAFGHSTIPTTAPDDVPTPAQRARWERKRKQRKK